MKSRRKKVASIFELSETTLATSLATTLVLTRNVKLSQSCETSSPETLRNLIACFQSTIFVLSQLVSVLFLLSLFFC